MNIEAFKNEIIKKLVDVQDENLLKEIEAILDVNSFSINSFETKNLTKFHYTQHIESISQSVADGAETYTSKQVRSYILAQ